MTAHPDFAKAIAADHKMWRDFLGLCDCGGRLAGTQSERHALALIAAEAEIATGATPDRCRSPIGAGRCGRPP